jgi:hypothetical protein
MEGHHMAKETAVQKKGETAIANYDYGDDAEAGFENVGQEDIVLPRLSILQALSPQVNGDEAIEGAKAGMLHINVNDQLYDGKEGIEFIGCYRQHVFTEWVPRKRGGGFVGSHAPDSEIVKKAKEGSTKFGKYNTDYSTNDEGEYKGNDLVETYELYGIVLTEDGPIPLVFPFTSTKIKKYRDWMTGLRIFRPKQKIPMFAHRVRLTTVSQEHAAGKSFNIKLGPATNGSLADSLIPPGDELLELGREVYEMAKKNRYRVDYEDGPSEGGDGGGGDSDKDEPPF